VKITYRKEDPMDQFSFSRHHARSAPLSKPGIELVFRRIAEASLRLELKARNAQRTTTMALFNEAACSYFTSMLRPTISDCYRLLKVSVLEACGSLSYLPSETTFRRRIARGKELAAEAMSKRR
jgi:hypothetical protein